MIEILAGEFDTAVKQLQLEAEKKFESNNKEFQVWAISKKSFDYICNIDDKDWKFDYGWFRYADGANTSPSICVKIKGIEVFGYEDCHDSEPLHEYEFDGLIEHISECLGAGMEKNICALSVEMAKYNKMVLSELFIKFY